MTYVLKEVRLNDAVLPRHHVAAGALGLMKASARGGWSFPDSQPQQRYTDICAFAGC